MANNIDLCILELKTNSARMQEKLINLENYIIRDLKLQMIETSRRLETRFKWTVGLFVSLMAISIGVSLGVCGGI